MKQEYPTPDATHSQAANASPIHVMAGVIPDGDGKILVTRRAAEAHQGGLWEFPGGKREAGETPCQTLKRELREELGIEIHAARPLIRIHHRYPDQSVELDAWWVERWHGKPQGREGQPLAWRAPHELRDADFPAANRGIIRAAQLPDQYLVTPSPDPDDLESFMNRLRACLDRSRIRLVQLRAPNLSPDSYRRLASGVLEICAARDARLLLNADPELVREVGAHGAHFNSARLKARANWPRDENLLLSTVCHNLEELRLGENLGADCLLVSPVRRTLSHPNTPPLGWQGFFQLSEQARCPAYALGNLEPRHLALAWSHGAQGIAAIRGLWEGHDTEGRRGWGEGEKGTLPAG